MTDPSQYFKGRTVQEQMDEVIGYVDTRAAEVATTAIASDVAQVHQDMLDADADAQAAAASAAAAAGTLANAVKKTGEASQSIAGDIAVSGDLDVGGDADITGALDVTGAITGNDASLIGTVTVPTEATGTYTMKAANSTKVKNELDNYNLMVRTTNAQTIDGPKTFKDSVNALPMNTLTALGWTHLFDIKETSHLYGFMMYSGSNILMCYCSRSEAHAIVFGNSSRPYSDVIKVAHNQIDDVYEVWFNAQYGSWARGYMINEGSGNGAGDPDSYEIKNIRDSEPTIGDTYDTIVISTRWSVVP